MKRAREVWGGILLVAGAALLLSVYFWPSNERWQVEAIPQPLPQDLISHYPPSRFERWQLHQKGAGKALTEHVLLYRDEAGRERSALVPEPGSRRWQNWMAVAQVLQTLEGNALILAWWDASQRIDLLSGRQTWVRQPPAEAFGDSDRDLWERLSGGFDDEDSRLAKLARWWLSDPSAALAEIRRQIANRPLYFLVSSEDLAHIEEIERLAGRRLPLQVRIFPNTGNLHGQIAAVQRWAGETGNGYLPQKIPGGIAAWRITDNGTDGLLLQLLPFSGVSHPPVPGLAQVFQTPDRSVSLYRVTVPATE